MKSIRKLFLFILVSFFPFTTFSQIFGVRGGLNLSNMLMKDKDYDFSEDFKIKPGFMIGPTADFSISSVLSIETGLLLSTKGYKHSYKGTYYKGGSYESNTKLNLLYLDIPIIMKGNYSISEQTYLFLAAGPYIGIGLTGKIKSESISNGEKETDSRDMEWGSDKENDFLKRLDYGLNFGAGVEFNSIQIALSYGLGLANISTYTDDDVKIKNRVLQFSLGYRFLPKHKNNSDP